MGFRFQKRITLLPGVRMNLSKSGASLSVGPRGASVTMGKQRSGSTGRVDDEYVAAAEIDRNGWNQVDCSQMSAIDPENLLRRFGAKMEVNSRGILKIQQPFE